MTGLRAAVLLCMISACLGCWKVYPVKDARELKSNLQCKCGVRNEKATRIVGGRDASKHEFPWQVVLLHGGKFYCGGSIISSKTILTAAHCVEDKEAKNIWAIIGEHDLKTTDVNGYILQICSKTIHPDYGKKKIFNYDFAVLTVCSEIDFTKEIAPICLPPMGSPEGSQYEHIIGAIVTGWGLLKTNGSQPNILQKSEVKTMTNNECCSWPYKWKCATITESMMCGTWTRSQAGTTGFCDGDSGGPLIAKLGNYGYSQIGIVSFSGNKKCAMDDYPDVYARVTKVKKWIINNMEGTVCRRPDLPAQCTTYDVLDESDRKQNFANKHGSMVDAMKYYGGSKKSPNWKGPGWYRFQSPAGTQISTSWTWHGCGSKVAVWMNTAHPTTTGTTEDNIKLCHNDYMYAHCWKVNNGKVTHCGDFYVYYLPDSTVRGGRYCAEKMS